MSHEVGLGDVDVPIEFEQGETHPDDSTLYVGCCRHWHSSVKDQHASLTRRIQGHFNYFGVSGKFRSLLLIIEQAKRS